MGSRSEDEEMVPEKDEDHASPGQVQDQEQVLSAEEAMGNRDEDKKTLPEKDEDAPSISLLGQAQDQDQERSKKRKLRGVWQKNGKWVAEIRDNGKRHWLGTYTTEQEAGLAFDRGAREHGRFDVELNFPKLDFPTPRELADMLERVFTNNAKKARSRRHRAEPHPRIPHPAEPDLPSSSERHPTNRWPLIPHTTNPNLPSSSTSHPPIRCLPIPHPDQPDLHSSSDRHAAKPRPAVGYTRKGDRGRKTSSSTCLQKKLDQFIQPFLMMLNMFVDDLMQQQHCAILIELVKVFIRCILRINYLALLNKKSQCQHEFTIALCLITKHILEELRRKRDQKRDCSKHPANPDIPSTSTAAFSEERLSDGESSIETREAFRENRSSSWLQWKLTQVLAPLRKKLSTFGDDLMHKNAGAILKELVETFIYCISRACSLAQRFDMAQRESGLEAINYAGERQYEYDVELGEIMLQQLGELYPSLQPMSQGNSFNRPPVGMHHSFIREQTNDVNMRDRPSTSRGVANVEAVSSHQNATIAGTQDSGDQGNETAELGHQRTRVESFTQQLVAVLEKEHDLQIDIIEALLFLISTSQEGEDEE